MNERCRPMLAVRGQPFDSAEYVFEVKWNGIRALAARHTSGWDMWGRELADYRPRYPEMQVLAALPRCQRRLRHCARRRLRSRRGLSGVTRPKNRATSLP